MKKVRLNASDDRTERASNLQLHVFVLQRNISIHHPCNNFEQFDNENEFHFIFKWTHTQLHRHRFFVVEHARKLLNGVIKINPKSKLKQRSYIGNEKKNFSFLLFQFRLSICFFWYSLSMLTMEYLIFRTLFFLHRISSQKTLWFHPGNALHSFNINLILFFELKTSLLYVQFVYILKKYHELELIWNFSHLSILLLSIAMAVVIISVPSP